MNKNNLSGFTAKANSLSGLIDVLRKFEDAYKPANPNLSLVNLENTLQEGRLAIMQVLDAEANYLNATSRRVNLFEELNQKLSRILAMLQSQGVNENLYHDLYLVVKQMKGYNRKKSATPEADPEKPNKHTGAYLTLEKRTEDFLQVIGFLELIPEYNPNNSELEIAALKTYQAQMEQMNEEVSTLENTLTFLRHQRDTIFFNDTHGIICLGRQVKANIRGTFGQSSPEHKLVVPFRFNIKKN